MQEFMYKMCDDGSYAVMSYNGDEENVIIPSVYGEAPITVLFDKLFMGHKEIKSIKIPDTVTDIGEFAFEGCENLHHVYLPEELENIWPYAFCRSSIEEITIPHKIISIAPCTFMDCKELKRIDLPAGLKKIRAWAFGGCISLTEINHEPGVQFDPQTFMRNELKGNLTD